MALTYTEKRAVELTQTGIAVTLVPTRDVDTKLSSTAPVEIQRAPDSSGSPNEGSAATIVKLPPIEPGGTVYVDSLPRTTSRYHYRFRHTLGAATGDWSSWIGPLEAVELTRETLAELRRGPGVAAPLSPALAQIGGQGRTIIQALDRMVPNAEFDLWENPGTPHAWTVDTGDSSSVTKETSVKFSGDESLKFSFGAGGSAGTYRGIITNDPTKAAFCIPLRPGLTYSIKVASRVSGIGNSESYRLTLTYNVAASLTDNKVFAYKAATTWQVDEWLVTVPAGAEAVSKLAIEFTRGNTSAHDFWVDALRVGEQQLGFFDNGDKSADFTIDWAKGASQKVRITGSSTKVVSFTNPPVGNLLQLEIVRAASGGSYQLPASIGWAAVTAPIPTESDDHADVYAFLFDAGNSRYIGTPFALDIAVKDVQVASGTLALGNDVVSTTYTINCGFQPKAIVFAYGRDPALAGQPAQYGFGFATGTAARRATAIAMEDAVATSNTAKYYTEAAAIAFVTEDAAVDGLLDIDAILSTGFRLIVDDALTNAANVLHWIAFGGADVSAEVGTKVIGSGTGNESVSGLGFQPDALLVATVATTSAPPVAEAGAQIVVGLVDNDGDEGVMVGASSDAGAASDATGYLVQGEFFAVGIASMLQRLSWVSYDSTGFTYNRVENDNVARRFFFLALRGVKANLSALSTPTDLTSVVSSAPLPWAPLGVLALSRGLAEDTIDTASTDLKLSVGFADKRFTNQRVVGATDDATADPTATNVSNPSPGIYVNMTVTSGAVEGHMKIQAWNRNYVDFIMTDADAAARRVLALILGA